MSDTTLSRTIVSTPSRRLSRTGRRCRRASAIVTLAVVTLIGFESTASATTYKFYDLLISS